MTGLVIAEAVIGKAVTTQGELGPECNSSTCLVGEELCNICCRRQGNQGGICVKGACQCQE